MSVLSIQPTYPIFTDIDGQPLENGFVWIGTANLDPQVNPIIVYWDAALTIPAVQPIRTLGGYPFNSGTPARLYVDSDYSIRVMNKNGSVVYSAPAATELISASMVSYLPAGTGAVATTVQEALYPKIASFGSATVDVLYRLGKNYEAAGTVEKTETRPFLHDYRPLGTAQGGSAVFSTDGANLFIGPGAGNFTMTPLDVPPAGIDRNLQCSHNLGIGVQALGSLTIGYKNVGIGVNAYRLLTTGFGNTAVGRDAGQDQTTGIETTRIGFASGILAQTGNYNVSVGSGSGYSNISGSGNINVGRRSGFNLESGDYNTFVGNESGDGHISGSYNTIIGQAAVSNGVTTGGNNTIIGARITGLENVSGQVVVAAGDGTKYLQTGTLSTNQARLDLVGREVTAVNLAATDGQVAAGSSLLLRSSANVGNAVTQVVFQSRVGQPFSRIVSWGGVTPNISLITNNVETARWNSLGDLQQKVNPTAAALGTNSTMTFALTSNTELQVRVRGTDGVTRTVTLTLA
jgi:hypothetical protein